MKPERWDWDDSSLSPATALKVRDNILACVQAHPKLLSDACDNRIYNPGLAAEMLFFLSQADVVIWRGDIWNVAQAGAGEAFAGLRVEPEDFPPKPQFWLMDVHIPSLDDPEVLSVWEIPSFFCFHAFFLFPKIERGVLKLYPVLNYGPNHEAGIPREDLIRYIDAGGDPMAFRLVHPLQPGEPPEKVGIGVLAALRFMETEFVENEQATLPRAIRRGAELGRRGKLPGVRVVTLRRSSREKEEADGEGGREYSCQWFVGAHWRKPSPRMKEQRPVFVRPYVKGPQDKPVKPPRERVYDVCR